MSKYRVAKRLQAVLIAQHHEAEAQGSATELQHAPSYQDQSTYEKDFALDPLTSRPCLYLHYGKSVDCDFARAISLTQWRLPALIVLPLFEVNIITVTQSLFH